MVYKQIFISRFKLVFIVAIILNSYTYADDNNRENAYTYEQALPKLITYDFYTQLSTNSTLKWKPEHPSNSQFIDTPLYLASQYLGLLEFSRITYQDKKIKLLDDEVINNKIEENKDIIKEINKEIDIEDNNQQNSIKNDENSIKNNQQIPIINPYSPEAIINITHHKFDKTYDLRKILLCLQPIENQLNCSASPAFAMIQSISDRICKKTPTVDPDKSLDLFKYYFNKQKNMHEVSASIYNMIACDFLSHGCKGMRTENILYRLKNVGYTHESCDGMKLLNNNIKCGMYCDDGESMIIYYKPTHSKINISDFPNKIYGIKVELISNGSLYAEMEVYRDLFYYKSGVYSCGTGEFVGYHAVRVCIYLYVFIYMYLFIFTILYVDCWVGCE